MIYCSSGSYFGKILVPAPVSVLDPDLFSGRTVYKNKKFVQKHCFPTLASNFLTFVLHLMLHAGSNPVPAPEGNWPGTGTGSKSGTGNWSIAGNKTGNGSRTGMHYGSGSAQTKSCSSSSCGSGSVSVLVQKHCVGRACAAWGFRKFWTFILKNKKN